MSDRTLRHLATRDFDAPLSAAAVLERVRSSVVEVLCEHCSNPVWCGVCLNTRRLTLATKQRLEIGAYAGSEGCREALKQCPACEGGLVRYGNEKMLDKRGRECAGYVTWCYSCKRCRPWPKRVSQFSHWISGLSRWPQALIRAAVAAAEMTLPVWETNYRKALTDAAATLPEKATTNQRRIAAEHRGQLLHTHVELLRRVIEAAKVWLADPSEERFEAWMSAWHATSQPEMLWLPHGRANSAELRDTIRDAATRLAGEKAVREGICAALIAWVL